MASIEEIAKAAKAAAAEALHVALEARVERSMGSDGEEVIRVMLVVPDGTMNEVSGEQIVATLLAVKRGVRDLGDDRPTVVSYATPGELADDGNSES